MTDPISDFLTRLRNASKARLDECVAPHSTMKEAIAAILKAEGYVADFSSSVDTNGHKTLVVKMKYLAGTPSITGIKRVSTPGRRLYYRYTEIPRVLNGLGIAIMSTSKGLMKDSDCRRNKAGGELVCNVW
ncbi:MAG TPA: 30S ribosomal protein S8 [Opitutaceae bacterium]|mgnify:FL=1|jgi:small subunit ribosomal protein S8|nr:MAG: 30S ribosomal protein S8 [Verrucomicrobia bacterium ADurb.Bin122]HOD46768.1 30S ribosomal protein S8 [Opitutaceae bacterium]HOF09683.1 30S ribosomal protein S8 [Opitutaceae bacterium]HOG93149.1 30S ribosomal protein S8 [Opitutaceae bacterium]HOR25100.1 30S ribosomal protein S8 [Opitutaceae bacterium]